MKAVDTKEGRDEFKRIRASFMAQCSRECGNCGSADDLEIHHIVPIIYGGTNRYTNLAVLCGACHDRAHGGRDSDNWGDTKREMLARGREAAKSRGVKFGPKFKFDPDVLAAAAEMAARPDVSVTRAALYAGCSRATLYNYIQRLSQQ